MGISFGRDHSKGIKVPWGGSHSKGERKFLREGGTQCGKEFHSGGSVVEERGRFPRERYS